MCGFLGAVSAGRVDEHFVDSLRTGLSAIRHRGPDATNFLAVDRFYLGHNRLSIIDLSDAANQPLKSASSEAWVVYNGEIYNFAELRHSLEPNTRFVTRSDTEVLLEGYLAEGTAFFKKLRGIYAFAILDRRSAPTMVLGRDPSGVKPLYYAPHKGAFVFASEIKALLPALRSEVTIDESVLKAYLNLGYCPEPRTIYREISAVRPGHALVISEHGNRDLPIINYGFADENGLSFEDNAAKVSELLDQAVRRNLVADVDTAVALSGGIDSSLVFAYAARANANIRGLTVRFNDPGYDETALAQQYARQLGATQQVISVDSDFSLETLNHLLLHFDQPFADASAIPVYYLTKAVRQHTKVLLGGDGGDELFNGYASLASLPFVHRSQQFGVAPVVRAMLMFAGRLSNDDGKRTLDRARVLFADAPSDMLFDWLSWFPRHTRFESESPFLYPADDGLTFYRATFKDEEPESFNGRLIFEHFRKLLLGDYLRKTDMMSMLNSVEYRVPLLDEDLVRFALSIPFHQKSSLRRHKKVLRYLHGRIFPAAASNAPKRGFSIPLDRHLSARDVAEMRELVLRPGSFVRSYIRSDYLRFVFDVAAGAKGAPRHLSRDGTYQRVLLFYALELWHRYGARFDSTQLRMTQRENDLAPHVAPHHADGRGSGRDAVNVKLTPA